MYEYVQVASHLQDTSTLENDLNWQKENLLDQFN